MGANKQQMLKAFNRAEAYPGSVPGHLLRAVHQPRHQKGMGKTQEEQRLAWSPGTGPCTGYNPCCQAGQEPLSSWSPTPDGSLQEFLSGETRYAMLEKALPKESKVFRTQLEQDYQQRYALLEWMASSEARFLGGEPEGAAAGLPVCEVAEVAEHARPGKGEEPCDDGRAGK
jgi:pyruvate-ferredoxin/flavodoxin oxidoreductase